MDYFLTSFFRIRVVVVLAFLALCFFVGSIENAFASRYEAVARIGNHSGSYVRDNLSTKQAHGRPQSISRAGDSFSELGWSPIVLRWTDTDIYSGGPITIVYCDHFDNDLASFATGARYVWQEALDDYLSLPISSQPMITNLFVLVCRVNKKGYK